jgi:PAS domain S-box-containing protein
MLTRPQRIHANYNLTMARRANQIRQTEEAVNRMHLIIEQSPEIIIITDLHGLITYTNPQFTKVTGYSLPDVAGRTPSFLKSGGTPESTFKQMWATIDKGETWRGEFHNKKKDGTSFWVRATVSPIRGDRGEIANFVAIEEDFTESKKMQDALLREKNRVEQLSRAKDEFMRTVTHELKTPLSVILGNMSMLRKMPPKAKEVEWGNILDMIDRNTLRLRRSIDQILQLSRLDTLKIKKEGVEIIPILEDIYAEHSALAQMKGLKLNMSLPKKGRKLRVIGDAELLRLSIANFVSNAIKFTEKGSVSLSVSSTPKEVSIKVSDTGIGIAKENIPNLFQKFFKANADAPGSGVGLALSAGIINKHGGKISVSSRLGSGSTFEIMLLRGVSK